MKKLQEIIKPLEDHREKLRKEYKIKSAKIFGSYAGGIQKKKVILI